MSTTTEQPHGAGATAAAAGPPRSDWPAGDGPDATRAAADAGASGEMFALAQQAACDQLAVLIGRAARSDCRARAGIGTTGRVRRLRGRHQPRMSSGCSRER